MKTLDSRDRMFWVGMGFLGMIFLTHILSTINGRRIGYKEGYDEGTTDAWDGWYLMIGEDCGGVMLQDVRDLCSTYKGKRYGE